MEIYWPPRGALEDQIEYQENRMRQLEDELAAISESTQKLKLILEKVIIRESQGPGPGDI